MAKAVGILVSVTDPTTATIFSSYFCRLAAFQKTWLVGQKFNFEKARHTPSSAAASTGHTTVIFVKIRL